MADKDHITVKALGLNTQPNDLGVPEGSLAVCENMEITRDNVAQLSPGFENFSTNLPAVLPEQIFSFAGTTYAITDSGWWYYDTTSSTWLRKRGNLGTSIASLRDVTMLNGHLYIATSSAVLDLNLSTGTRTLIAGVVGVTGTADGTGTAARFSGIGGITSDGTNLFVTDGNNFTIRKVAPPLTAGAAVVTTIAGSAGSVGSADGTGTVARFSQLTFICCDGTNLYATDGNSTVRKIAPPFTLNAGVVTTIAGTFGSATFADGTGAVARFSNPQGIATDGTNLYVADTGNQRVRRLAPPLTAGAAVVTTIAGSAGSGHADGTGAAASFTTPTAVAYRSGALYLTESFALRLLSAPLTAGAAVVTTIAGGASTGTVDGIGTAARFSTPNGLDTDGTVVYIADFGANAIRKAYLSTRYVATIDGVFGLAGVTGAIPLMNGFVQGPS